MGKCDCFFLVFFFISKTFIGPMSASRTEWGPTRLLPLHVWGWENFPARSHCPKWNSSTTQLIGGLTSVARMPRGLKEAKPAALPGQGCVWSQGWQEGLLGIRPGPHDHLHVNGHTKVPPTAVARAPLGSEALSFVLVPSPQSLDSTGCQQAFGKLIMRDLSPSSSPEPR